MLRDRGKLKWQGMFLPEHIQALKELNWNQSQKKQPELDEQQLQRMEETIHEAMAYNVPICFTYYQKGDFHLLIGRVHYADTQQQALRIVDFHGDRHTLKLTDIIDVAPHE
ncbi:hypothetical protein A374_06046 [Fictibacillus macauensis ZFHKF-1]|uniref:YolD-like protein n=1 Tax=Fictibacillus macauensis ZFHKF-1 TaxID=1196324 RepID=I8AK01_9BACL|nr:YolD-like family protein [Fictibacillus macauensis]EIT86137.1 hypothetical protein A374_06046 [Fictibacillus macauensis ZFHKF-1]